MCYAAESRRNDFNPRSREGSDQEQLAKQLASLEFQSTLP